MGRAHLLSSAVLLAACGGATTHMYVIDPSQRADTARPEGEVDVYVNAPPTRPFSRRYLVDRPLSKDTGQMIDGYRASAAAVGCDGVVVYTREHPVWRVGPKGPDDVLKLDEHGQIVSAPASTKVPDRYAVFVDSGSKTQVVTDARTLAICIDYVAAPASPVAPDE